MKIDFAVRVDKGPKLSNDDRALAGGVIYENGTYSGTVEAPTLFTVCDGCGGYDGGYLAAETVLRTLASASASELSDEAKLKERLEECKARVYEKKALMPQYKLMCTTVVGCVFADNKTALFHAGDSRLYRYDKWGLSKMTVDHSAVQALVNMGHITAEEAREHPSRNIINRCIGAECPSPDTVIMDGAAAVGEKYLFCSDGLWEYVTEADMEALLGSNISLTEAVDTLVEKAKANGADDNITACLCTVQGTEQATESKAFVLD